jgi:hypothetical protein
MTVEEIRTAYYTKPFQPFLVRLTDGRKFRVRERHNLGISPTGKSIGIATATDEFVEINISDIAALEVKKTKRQKRSA